MFRWFFVVPVAALGERRFKRGVRCEEILLMGAVSASAVVWENADTFRTGHRHALSFQDLLLYELVADVVANAGVQVLAGSSMSRR